MSPLDPMAARVLEWSGSLASTRTLGQLAATLAQPPGMAGEALTGVLLLLDPRHELRRLTEGEVHPADTGSGLRFVDSLSGVAPGYGTLHAPWTGAIPRGYVPPMVDLAKSRQAALDALARNGR